MALKEYTGPAPISGRTYVANWADSITQAEHKFRSSGMEYMFYKDKYLERAEPGQVVEVEAPKVVKPVGLRDFGLPVAAPKVWFDNPDKQPIKSDGGPSTYYDFKPDWVTLNDAMEYLAEHRWGKYALHLKDSMKACFRFGSKDGADVSYDAKKLVYSGLRLLVMIEGKGKVQQFLAKLAADPQFQSKE